MTTDATTSATGENSQVANTQEPQTMLTDDVLGSGENQQQDSANATGNDENAAPEGEGKLEQPEGAPESYEFVAPEGKTFDAGVIDVFSSVARELNLPQDKAQLVLDKMAPIIAQRQIEQIEAVRAEWAEQTRADKEIGGDRLNENLAIAKQAVDKFAPPEMRKLMKNTGLGNHPAVIKHFYLVGKAISQDSIVNSGDPTNTGAGRPAADVLYDKTSSLK